MLVLINVRASWRMSSGRLRETSRYSFTCAIGDRRIFSRIARPDEFQAALQTTCRDRALDSLPFDACHGSDQFVGLM
jgi:hypothetical protein